MTFQIQGEHNTATVQTNQDRDDCEKEALDQIQEMVDHEAFVGDEDVAIQPDFHWGSGAVIGFTMPIKDRVVPNTVGVDLGCGMFAVKLDVPQFEKDDETLAQIDEAIRNRVPMGFDVHDRNDYHMINDFPWTVCTGKLASFADHTDFDLPDPSGVYTESYFEELCQKVGYDQGRAINSMGTLGGGNHFIELGTDSDGDVWCIIHSGSRGIGAAIAQYWQDVATEKTFARNAEVEIPEHEVTYFEQDEIEILSEDDGAVTVRPGSLQIDREAILDDYEGEAIEGKFGQLKSFMNAGKEDSSPLDYLEGDSDESTGFEEPGNSKEYPDEATGYIIDMIFAQTYASESRKKMAQSVNEAITAALGLDYAPSYFEDQIESVHNYIDFEDATIRKGACRAHEGERLVVPFNMAYGTILARGKGKDDWNNSSAHGAGRAMSRTAAKDQFDQDDFDEQIGDVFMSKQPMDEIPGAYKPAGQVEAALGDSVDVIDRVEPFLSIKAE